MIWILGGFFVLVTLGFVYQILWERKKALEGHCGQPWVEDSGYVGRCRVCGQAGLTFSWYSGRVARGRR